MTREDLRERAAFWQAGLMDVDHLRDVAYEAIESEFECQEFRLIAGDSRLGTDDARDQDLAETLDLYLRIRQVDPMGLEDGESSARLQAVAVQEILALRPKG